ncbi:MAG: YidH family protein [Candidatus Zipacnadales bacterium]
MTSDEIPYTSEETCQLILRDFLAIDRTTLANERTLLAYIRTGLALLAAGFSFIQFFQSLWLEVLGWMIVPLGVGTLWLGGTRYLTMAQQIRAAREGSRGERARQPGN